MDQFLKMVSGRATVAFVACVVVASIFCANIALQLDIDIGVLQPQPKALANTYVHHANVTGGDAGLVWFLQVSDLHLSIFSDETRATELQAFCSTTLDAINPMIVLATGDLTDGKHKNNMGSMQYKEEWILYNDILNKCNIKNKTLWLDIRGNHDNFNVPGWRSSVNYFRNYSIQGGENPLSYMHIIKKNSEKYAFIGIDACLEPGPRRPFNFIGILTEDEISKIKRFLQRVEAESVDHVIWFGHYPSSCIISKGEETFRDLIGSVKKSRVYLCGHLHQVGGLIKEMYALQRQGYLELELSDWKDNRMFRLAAIDHGLFSFIDVKHDEWPIALITHPKHALFVIPNREPLELLNHSAHIRILAFSTSAIDLVQVRLDHGEWTTCQRDEGPLYTCKWDARDYAVGLHDIHVRVHDVADRERIVSQPFSLDGTKMDFKLFAKLVLMLNAVRVFQSMFGTMIMLCVLPLVVLRYLHHQTLAGQTPPLKLRQKYNYKWLRRLWVLASVDRLFYPLVLYEIYLTFGPWSFGEVMDGHRGAIFAWGIIMDGIYLPGCFTYAYGFIQMFICQLPLTLILAKCADERYMTHWGGRVRHRSLCTSTFVHLPFILIISTQMVLAYFFWLAYGTMAFLLGPLRTWSVVLNFYLWYKAITLPPEATREVASVWMSHRKEFSRNIPSHIPDDY